ncbi:MAG: hypothetical protein SGJ27_31520 [Candidatus Melainabacteria bacterium]|nr:hypothetical protein [Candidatus Melainabacteria bacterium]
MKKDDVVSRRLRAYSYYQLDKDDASLSDYNILINSGRGEAQDYAYRSLVNSQTKRFESAASDAAIAVKKDSLCAPAYYARGLSEFHGGSDKDALNDAKLACQLDYELPMPYVLMAMIFNKKQKFDRAILMCEAGLQYDPTNGAAHWQIAAAQVNLKDYDKAIDSCTVALSLADHRAEKSGALSTRALAQFHRSRNEEAIADATKALIFDPECLLAYEVRAMSHDRLNHTNEAAQDREAAKRIKERMTSFQNKTSKSDQNNGTAVITKEQREHNKIHESTNTLRPAPSIKDQRSHRK